MSGLSAYCLHINDHHKKFEFVIFTAGLHEADGKPISTGAAAIICLKTGKRIRIDENYALFDHQKFQYPKGIVQSLLHLAFRAEAIFKQPDHLSAAMKQNP